MLVVDDTLLLFNPKPGNNRIPARTPDGHPIRIVGKDALKLPDPSPAALVVEEGIESMDALDGEKLFLPHSLRKFYETEKMPDNRFPSELELWRGMRAEAWQAVLDNSHPISGNRRIFTGSWETLDIRCSRALKAPWFPFGVDELFPVFTRSCTKELPCLPVEGNCTRMSVADAIMKIVRGQARNVLDPQSERAADHLMRSSLLNGMMLDPFPDAFELTIIHPPLPVGGDGSVLFRASVMHACWFYCTAHPLVFRGERYWVGSINYLNENGYDRTDVAVFTEEGLVNDRAVREEVYAKHMLMSVL